MESRLAESKSCRNLLSCCDEKLQLGRSSRRLPFPGIPRTSLASVAIAGHAADFNAPLRRHRRLHFAKRGRPGKRASARLAAAAKQSFVRSISTSLPGKEFSRGWLVPWIGCDSWTAPVKKKTEVRGAALGVSFVWHCVQSRGSVTLSSRSLTEPCGHGSWCNSQKPADAPTGTARVSRCGTGSSLDVDARLLKLRRIGSAVGVVAIAAADLPFPHRHVRRAHGLGPPLQVALAAHFESARLVKKEFCRRAWRVVAIARFLQPRCGKPCT